MNREWEILETERLPCFSQHSAISNEQQPVKGATPREGVCHLYSKPNMMHSISGTPSFLCWEITVAFRGSSRNKMMFMVSGLP